MSGATAVSLKVTGKSNQLLHVFRVPLYRACILYWNTDQVLLARPLSRFLILTCNEVPISYRLVLKFIATSNVVLFASLTGTFS